MAETVSELLPCPFCGGEAAMTYWESGHSRRKFFRVYCDAPNPPGCSAEPFVDDEVQANAIAAWNRRATDPAVAELVEALKDVLPKMELFYSFYGDDEYVSGVEEAVQFREAMALVHALIAKHAAKP